MDADHRRTLRVAPQHGLRDAGGGTQQLVVGVAAAVDDQRRPVAVHGGGRQDGSREAAHPAVAGKAPRATSSCASATVRSAWAASSSLKGTSRMNVE